MNDTPTQSTLREWRGHMAQPARLAGFLGATLILTIVGPFGTDNAMHTLSRIAYWGVIVVACYSVGYFGTLVGDNLAGPKAKRLRRLLIAAPLTAVGVMAVVYAMNGLTINYWATGAELAMLAGNVVVISCIISTMFHVADSGAQISTALSSQPTLLDRIAFDKRAPLVSLSVEDHYVRIRTIKGEDMVLMRLADAIREVGETSGLHVHRSHWIALDQVTAATRNGDGAILTMSHGPDIPVSRANIPSIKEAGLLPRS